MPRDHKVLLDRFLTVSSVRLAAIIHAEISQFAAWPNLSNDLEHQAYMHEKYNNLCDGRICNDFINSDAYQGWVNRKTRGPSLLYVSGSGRPCSDKYCGKSTELTLKTSCIWEIDTMVGHLYPCGKLQFA